MVQLAHPADQILPGFFINFYLNGRIFTRNFTQNFNQFRQIAGLFWFNSLGDNRLKDMF